MSQTLDGTGRLIYMEIYGEPLLGQNLEGNDWLRSCLACLTQKPDPGLRPLHQKFRQLRPWEGKGSGFRHVSSTTHRSGDLRLLKRNEAAPAVPKESYPRVPLSDHWIGLRPETPPLCDFLVPMFLLIILDFHSGPRSTPGRVDLG